MCAFDVSTTRLFVWGDVRVLKGDQVKLFRIKNFEKNSPHASTGDALGSVLIEMDLCCLEKLRSEALWSLSLIHI